MVGSILNTDGGLLKWLYYYKRINRLGIAKKRTNNTNDRKYDFKNS